MARDSGVVFWSILSVVSFLAAAPGAAAAADAPVIRVVASDTISAKPDQAELALGVTTDKKTAAAAVAENDRKMEAVLAVLKKEVGSDGEVKTTELSVRPRFQERRDAETAEHIIGYTVTHIVQVRTANIRAAARLLDVAFEAGANTVERVDFTLKDPAVAQNQALRGASAKARARAVAMAEGQGLRVGDVLSVSEGDTEAGELLKSYQSNLRRSVRLVPEAGAIDVSATVTVVFALKR
jgi:uncharacterized protein YggE